MTGLTVGDFERARLRHPFAAVLGDPVGESRTPSEHAEFFRPGGVVVYRVCVPESEPDPFARLEAAGLRWAAVTSPLKRPALAWLRRAGGREHGYLDDALNTLVLGWERHGASTDWVGLDRSLGELVRRGADLSRVAVWGGGGVLSTLVRRVPWAETRSARSGLPRPGSPDVPDPDLVVWAAGPADREGWAEPPASWRPRHVLDLSQDGPASTAGDLYALRARALRLSGDTWFLAQAAAQRALWAALLPPAG